MNRIFVLLPVLVLSFTVMPQRRKFDVEAFNKNKNESDYRYFTDQDGYSVVQYGDANGFVELRKKPGDLFEEYRAFYGNGSLKEEKLCLLNRGFCKGKGYVYHPAGMLVEVIDYDAPYKYTWENVLNFVKKNSINLYDSHTLIQRYEDREKGFCWHITWKVPMKPAVNVAILSGEDGRVLEQRVSPFIK
jgi:hypothetical protein